MWRNYMVVGLRALAKNRTYAFINIFGLSLGIAACLLILNYVRYEFGYDEWLGNVDNTYQLQTIFLPSPQGGTYGVQQTTAIAAETAFRKDFPQAEAVVWLSSRQLTFIRNGTPSVTQRGFVTDGPLFQVLRVPFVRGNPATVLSDPHAIVLSETEAKRQFGGADPIGQTLTVVSGDMQNDYCVTGVFKDIPKNSHLEMSAVARVDPVDYFRKTPDTYRSWTWQTGTVYVSLKPGTDVSTINTQIPSWKKRNIPDDPSTNPPSNPGDFNDYKLVNVRDIHLSDASGQGRANGDRTAIVTFGVIALLILAMACMNFTNLATARASQRAREVALRKVLGANRRQLITQFIGESMLVAAIAMLIALALAEIAIRPLNAFLDADMRFAYFGAHGVLLPVIALTVIVGLAGGLYPAFYLSRFEPARILKANKSAADAEGNGRLRTTLVVTQFAVSIALIICTAVIYAQTGYARSIDAGYRRSGLLQLDPAGDPQVEAAARTFLQEVRKLPNVTDAAPVGLGIDGGTNSTTDVNVPGKPPVALGIYGTDTRAFATLGLRLLAGRNFSETIAMDDWTLPGPPDLAVERAMSARGVNVVLSELAAKRLGFATAAAAIGKPIQLVMTSNEIGLTTATVIGVVSDANYHDVRTPIQPIVYFYRTAGFNRLLVRFTGNPAAARASVEALWKRLLPTVPIDAPLVEDIVYRLYNADEKRAQLFGAFALLAVVIGCLGLFGLAAFTAERRTKEIGIRKVLGARTRDIVQLLVWQFSRPVLIANLIAWPIAWWIMRDWLNGFDQRIAMTPVPFLEAGLLALLIAVSTIAAHAWRVARTSPVKALRYE